MVYQFGLSKSQPTTKSFLNGRWLTPCTHREHSWNSLWVLPNTCFTSLGVTIIISKGYLCWMGIEACLPNNVLNYYLSLSHSLYLHPLPNCVLPPLSISMTFETPLTFFSSKSSWSLLLHCHLLFILHARFDCDLVVMDMMLHVHNIHVTWTCNPLCNFHHKFWNWPFIYSIVSMCFFLWFLNQDVLYRLLFKLSFMYISLNVILCSHSSQLTFCCLHFNG